MSEAHIAAKTPMRLELQAGTYWWCACGQSQNQPWCDGSHKGSEFSPTKLEIAETRMASLCCCKRSGNSPFCDGAHKAL